jgi:hypothetical protein
LTPTSIWPYFLRFFYLLCAGNQEQQVRGTQVFSNVEISYGADMLCFFHKFNFLCQYTQLVAFYLKYICFSFAPAGLFSKIIFPRSISAFSIY